MAFSKKLEKSFLKSMVYSLGQTSAAILDFLPKRGSLVEFHERGKLAKSVKRERERKKTLVGFALERYLMTRKQ